MTSLPEMLANYRENASPFLRQQARVFRSMSAADQRELLFYLMANMAVAQSAMATLAAIEPERPCVQ